VCIGLQVLVKIIADRNDYLNELEMFQQLGSEYVIDLFDHHEASRLWISFLQTNLIYSIIIESFLSLLTSLVNVFPLFTHVGSARWGELFGV
jgi:hypothetical protein